MECWSYLYPRPPSQRVCEKDVENAEDTAECLECVEEAKCSDLPEPCIGTCRLFDN